jgi:class 3 adenylate cyclase
MGTLSFEHAFKSPISAVWRAVSDTDRFNKALGFPPATYRDEPQPDGTSRRFVRQGKLGFEIAYEELPFAWIHERSFRVERIYESGPLERLVHTCVLEPKDSSDPNGGCRARVTWDWEPRGPFALVAQAMMKRIALKPFKRVFAEIDERLSKESTDAIGGAALRIFADGRPASSEELARIESIVPRVIEIHDSPLIARLAEVLATETDRELRRMQPLGYARVWSADPAETIDTFLAATRAGLLRMRWDVICPHCRGDKKNLASLSDATERAFCAGCNIDFDVDLDRSLEAVFTPHPQVRPVEEARYCLGGPGATPHMFYQRLLAPGEAETAEIPLPPGRYRLRFTGEKTYRWLDVGADQAATRRAPATFEIGDQAIDGADASLAAGGAHVGFRNKSSRRVLVNIESVSWATDALSAGEMIAGQRFRDLFSGEVLAPGVKLAIESATILFTDLVGSTAMYESIGDASAFSLVWTHFDALREIIAQHRGSIVKTIGDAIMAVFMRPQDSLLAAGDLHSKVAPYCRERGHAHPVRLKIGIHEGACIAVTLNDRLDYFGSTVNLAARVEAQSKGGDIVVSKALADHTSDAAVLRAGGWVSEPLAAHCKGFAEPIPMLRFFAREVTTERAKSPLELAGPATRPA